jgi:UDP-N-acetylmuramoyl-L-alanyl-D-glutamate--2,6-diaminopimelate ligase
MKNSGCTHVVLEVSSEGLKQYRHIGVHYDIAVFTNLSPEHLPSHNNSFEEYKKAKSRLFLYTQKTFKKEVFGFKKISIVNIDSEHGSYYLNIPLDQNLGYSLQEYMIKGDVDIEKNSIKLDGVWCTIKVPGIFNMNNALVGYMVGTTCGLPIEKIKKGIEAVTYIPGRMEEVVMGQSFRVFIDYAHEKLSMENLLTTGKAMKKNGGKIIVLFGAEGGGRDKRKRKEMAIVADTLADYVILSDVDPYDDNPDQIIADIAEHFTEKKTDENLFLIPDRTEGIKKAFSLAHENDIVFICGKGAEKSMERAGKVIPWDEQKIVRTLLQNHLSQ